MTEQAVGRRVLGGRYRLRSLLAAGGMGAVWVADDALLGRPVAVKLLSEALAGDGLAAERLRREARAAAGLEHPGIARVLDLGEDGGRPYLVMELLHGQSLAQRLAYAGPLPPAEAARVVAAAAEALQVAHRAGIVHRDVKPGNVFLTGDGEVKLLDFGIASAANQAALTGGDVIGTAAYLAPERMLGHDATPASDVYALGVLLYELLAGRPPFTADSGTALAMAHLHARPAPLRDAAPGVPPALAAACEQALAKDPAARPPSAAAFARLLRSTPAGTPPTTAPLPPAAAPAPPPNAASTRRLPATGGVAGTRTPAATRRRAPGPGRRPAAATVRRRPAAATVDGRRTRRRRGAWVAAGLLLAALLAAGPSLGGLLLDGLGPARPSGRPPTGADSPAPADRGVPGGLGEPAPADGQAPGGTAGGQAPAGGGTVTSAPAGTPGAADPPRRDLGGQDDQDDRDDGGSGEGGGGSSGPG
ncbi:MAG TPA: serine/threonine-protein kinase [Actinomycetes bacterium]|nr:serine/threonine-protein kinase [Actinomycetes bacterium]